MAINNDLLEFLQQPRCKTAMMVISLFIFITLSITEITNQPSEFMRSLALMTFTFWAGRATKSNWDLKK